MGTGNCETVAGMTGGAVTKRMEGKLPFCLFLDRDRRGTGAVRLSGESKRGGRKHLQRLQFPGWPNSLGQAGVGELRPSLGSTPGARTVLGSSIAPDHPARCPGGWLPELFVRTQCFLLLCREQHLYAGLQATLPGQEKASPWEDDIFPSSFQPELYTLASRFSCVVSLHLQVPFMGYYFSV